MDVVCFGQQNWNVCWTAKQQLTTRLAQRGHRVLYVDPDPVVEHLGPREWLRSLAPAATGFGLTEHESGVHIFTHRHAPALGWRLNRRRRGDVLRAVVRRLGFREPVALSLLPAAAADVRAVRPRGYVYYAVDEMSAFGDAPDAVREAIRQREEAVVRDADVALGVSERLHRRFARIHTRAHLLVNAADLDHFAPERVAASRPLPELSEGGRPSVCFVGQIDERLDQTLLVSLARRQRDWQFVLAGRIKQGVDVSALKAEPNVRLLGYQPYEALPGILRDADVCMVPYVGSPLTHACSPLKVYEYLATGLPVVSTPLEGLAGCRAVVAVAADVAGFEAAIKSALADPAVGRTERLAFAAANGWDNRVSSLERYLEEAIMEHDRRRLRPVREASGALRTAAEPPAPPTAGLSPVQQAWFLGASVVGWGLYVLRLAARAVAGRPRRVQRILVARPSGRLGDLVAISPALTALRRRYPDARIVLGVGDISAAQVLFGASPDVDEVRDIAFLRRPTRAGRAAGALRMLVAGYDLVISGATYFVSPESFMSGAPLRIGLDDGHPLQRRNHRVLPLDPAQPEAENNLRLVEALGVRLERAARVPRVWIDAVAAAAGSARLLADLGIPTTAPIVVLHPGAQKPSRRWPVERFSALAERLLAAQPDLHVVVTGGRAEAELASGLRARVRAGCRDRVYSAAGRSDLVALAGLLDHCAAAVCNDTGVMHLARARGAPLVALLGPENDRRWGPHPDGLGPAVALRHEVPCAPCSRWSCEHHYCLRLLGEAEVADEVLQLLEQPIGPTAADGDEPHALHERRAKHGWASLSAKGFLLPLVTVVVLPTEHDESASGALSALARQNYPAIEAIVVVPNGHGQVAPAHSHATDGLTIRWVASVAGDSRAVERAALLEAQGDLVVVAPPLDWEPTRLGDEVARAVREAEQRLAPGEAVCSRRGVLYHRAELGLGTPATVVTAPRAAAAAENV